MKQANPAADPSTAERPLSAASGLAHDRSEIKAAHHDNAADQA
jgi:hypothetical protein